MKNRMIEYHKNKKATALTKVEVHSHEVVSDEEKRKQEAQYTFICGAIYSSLETFAIRFGLPFGTITKRVGEFLLNAQSR